MPGSGPRPVPDNWATRFLRIIHAGTLVFGNPTHWNLGFREWSYSEAQFPRRFRDTSLRALALLEASPITRDPGNSLRPRVVKKRESLKWGPNFFGYPTRSPSTLASSSGKGFRNTPEAIILPPKIKSSPR
jgi:hypothetical protein